MVLARDMDNSVIEGALIKLPIEQLTLIRF